MAAPDGVTPSGPLQKDASLVVSREGQGAKGVRLWSMTSACCGEGSYQAAITLRPKHGMQMIAFVATLVLCGLAMVRTWREQHRYA